MNTNEQSRERQLDLSAIRDQLAREYEQLKERAEEDLDGSQRERLNPDRADLAQNYTLRAREVALQDVDDKRLDQVEQALNRLESGTYGQCSNCGRPISLERLQVMPTAQLCIDCQEKQEQV